MKKILGIFLLIGSSISAAFAFNTSFLDYSPVFYFTEQDAKLMHQATERALNQSGNQTITWNNPNTGAKGYLIPSGRMKKNNLTCRNLTIYSEANHMTGRSTYVFCRVGSAWKIVS